MYLILDNPSYRPEAGPSLMTPPVLTRAIDLAFGRYSTYSIAPTEEALFHLLSALEELDGALRLESGGGTSLTFPEFVALMALRKQVSNVTYARHVMRLRHLPGILVKTDIRQACLVARSDCIAALMRRTADTRDELKSAFDESFKRWGSVVDVNPSTFNAMVKTFELLRENGFSGTGSAYLAFEESWKHEVALGLPHYVQGPVPRESESGEIESLMAALYGAA
jgi:hypothetical protein